MKQITLEIREEWAPLLIGAHRLITQVMEAGAAQRGGHENADDGWMRLDPEQRLHHMFMHMVATRTHLETVGNPWSLTSNTALEDYKHAGMGAIIAITRLEVLDDKVVEAQDE